MQELKDKRIRTVVGHYGSGKTEFSVNYAMKLAEQNQKTALIDLDIANPYFRSRERQKMLESSGISVYSNTFGYDITADLPAITGRIRAPLEDEECQTIVDAGGDETGAMILIQFQQYFSKDDCDILCVINGNRPETATVDGALKHIRSIEEITGLKVTGLVNNTHMIRETEKEDILKGYRICKEISDRYQIPLKYNCCVKELCGDLEQTAIELNLKDFVLFPLTLYMRESWLDR